METTTARHQDWSHLLDQGSHRPETVQRHRLSWFITGGEIEFEMECLHGPMPDGLFCDAQAAREDPAIFPESFAGEKKTPLHEGIIISGWESNDDSWDLWLNTPTSPTATRHPDLLAGTQLE